MQSDIVITGCGVVSPLGSTADSLWESICAGKSGVATLSLIPTDALPVSFGGEVKHFTGQIDDFGPLQPSVKRTIRKGLKIMCREIQMGVAAAQMGLSDAQLDTSTVDPERTGVVYGCDYIMTIPDEFAEGVRDCLDSSGEFRYQDWPTKGMARVTPLWLLKYLPNMPACHVAIYNDLRGPNNSITVREASANLAVAEACNTIGRGGADTIVCGATGSRIHPLRTVHTVLQEQLATGSGEPASMSRPFDRDRQGMVIGEGAGVIVLEREEGARRRGVPILGRIVGYGASAALDRKAVARRDVAMHNAMRQALRSAGLAPSEIGHIQAHGLGTESCDIDEARAIERVFGEDAGGKRPVPVWAAKSYFGNLGAASGMIELIVGLMAVRHGQLPRMLNCDNQDPECPVRVVTETEDLTSPYVLNLNVTPQGQASAVILRGDG